MDHMGRGAPQAAGLPRQAVPDEVAGLLGQARALALTASVSPVAVPAAAERLVLAAYAAGCRQGGHDGPGLAELREQAAALVRDALEEFDPAGEEWVQRNAALAEAAHAAGYRLADEDWRRAAQYPPAVADFLRERLEQARRDYAPAFGEIGPGPDVRALERVIGLLERK